MNKKISRWRLASLSHTTTSHTHCLSSLFIFLPTFPPNFKLENAVAPGKSLSGVGCGLWLWHSLDFSINCFSHKFSYALLYIGTKRRKMTSRKKAKIKLIIFVFVHIRQGNILQDLQSLTCDWPLMSYIPGKLYGSVRLHNTIKGTWIINMSKIFMLIYLFICLFI